LIAQSERRVEVQSRTARGWELVVVEAPEDRIILEILGAALLLEAIYEGSGRRVKGGLIARRRLLKRLGPNE
jgi:hypothetical protein